MRRYTLIAKDVFSAYAFKETDEFCEIKELLNVKNAENKENFSERAKIVSTIYRLVQNQLKTGPVHHDLGDGIRQISAGKYRLLYFFDEGHLIIFTHHFIKKTSKTPSAQTDKAKEQRDLYFKAKKENTLILMGDDNG